MKSRVGLVVVGLLAAVIPSMSWAAVSVSVGNATGQPDETVDLAITVNIDGGDIVGSLDITTAWQNVKVRVPAKGTSTSNADCTADVEATLAQFKFVPNPPQCLGDECTGVRAAILGPESGYNATAVFYTCKVHIDATTEPGDYQFTVPSAKYAKLDGTEVVITGTPGTVTVAGEPTNTPVPSATSTPPVPTVTATRVPTNTAPPIPTATRTSIPTQTSTPSNINGANDGCQMGSQSSSNALLMLLLPVAFAAVLRRRNR